jgi:hypothetical protein
LPFDIVRIAHYAILGPRHAVGIGRSRAQACENCGACGGVEHLERACDQQAWASEDVKTQWCVLQEGGGYGAAIAYAALH